MSSTEPIKSDSYCLSCTRLLIDLYNDLSWSNLQNDYYYVEIIDNLELCRGVREYIRNKKAFMKSLNRLNTKLKTNKENDNDNV